MINSSLIKQEFAKRFGPETPETDCCARLFDFFTKTKSSSLRHLTYVRLRDISNYPDTVLISALLFLSSAKINILDQRYEFLDTEDDEYIEIEPDVVSSAIKNNEFYHPESGKKVENFKSKSFYLL